jgi:hypothetical protein
MQIWLKFDNDVRSCRSSHDVLRMAAWFLGQLQPAVLNADWHGPKQSKWEQACREFHGGPRAAVAHLDQLDADAIDWAHVSEAWAVERGIRWDPARGGPGRGGWVHAWPPRPGVEVPGRARPVTVSILLSVPDADAPPPPAGSSGAGAAQSLEPGRRPKWHGGAPPEELRRGMEVEAAPEGGEDWEEDTEERGAVDEDEEWEGGDGEDGEDGEDREDGEDGEDGSGQEEVDGDDSDVLDAEAFHDSDSAAAAAAAFHACSPPPAASPLQASPLQACRPFHRSPPAPFRHHPAGVAGVCGGAAAAVLELAPDGLCSELWRGASQESILGYDGLY